MHNGMLWFDNSDTTLEQKVQKGVSYYVDKYGKSPNLCLVHPTSFSDTDSRTMQVGNVLVRPYRPVLPGHLWIGIEDNLHE